MQYYAVNIPEKVGPGMQFYVQLGGQLLTVTCPAGAGPGTLIQVRDARAPSAGGAVIPAERRRLTRAPISRGPPSRQVQAPAGIAPPPPPAPAVVMGAPFQTFDQPPPSAPGGVPAGAAREGSRWIVPPPYNPNPSQPGWIIAYPDPVPLPPSAEPTFRIPIDVDEPYANAAERRRAAVERRCVKVNQIRVVNACCCCYQGCAACCRRARHAEGRGRTGRGDGGGSARARTSRATLARRERVRATACSTASPSPHPAPLPRSCVHASAGATWTTTWCAARGRSSAACTRPAA